MTSIVIFQQSIRFKNCADKNFRNCMSFKNWDAVRRETGACAVSLRFLVLMPVMQFRQVRVIMGEGQVQMQMSVRFLKNSLSVMPVVVMIFVLMSMVML
jgi:hypothetical protein